MRPKPEYKDIRRSMAIVRRLQTGPADKAVLMASVRIEVGIDAYAEDEAAAKKQFERDIDRLRSFGVDLALQTGHEYSLTSYGDFSPVSLDDRELGALAFLHEAFAPGAPESEAVQQLLRRVLDWIPERQRTAVSTKRLRLRIDLRRRDEDIVPPIVEDAVNKALAERRRLRFWYRSPGQSDGEPRQHTVEPWYLNYDAVRHHLYLDAYRVRVEGPLGVWDQPRWQRYRLGRILPDEIAVLPDRLPPTPPKRPSYALQYLLAPEIARLGQVSRHFENMAVHPPDETGWVRVTATTNDLFSAIQLLLGYGPRCRVMGGVDARREMEANVQAMAAYYKLPA